MKETTLYIETVGEGSQDLVLIHGWAMHGGIWEKVRSHLATCYRLHLVDLPGHGYSPTLPSYRLSTLVEMLTTRFDKPVSVAGWSLGGLVAQAWALAYPQQIQRLILVASSPCFSRRPNWPHATAPATLRQFAQALSEQYETTLKHFLTLQAFHDEAQKSVLLELREKLFARGKPSVEGLQAALQLLLTTDLRPQIPQISQPTLLVYGERDMQVPKAVGQWLLQHLPQARLLEVAGAAHTPFLTHVTDFTTAVTHFMETPL